MEEAEVQKQQALREAAERRARAEALANAARRHVDFGMAKNLENQAKREAGAAARAKQKAAVAQQKQVDVANKTPVALRAEATTRTVKTVVTVGGTALALSWLLGFL